MQNDEKSKLLRHNIMQALLPNTFEELRVLNPEIIPDILGGKKIHLDVLLKDVKTKELVAIEMQVSRFTNVQSKRFQYYGSRLVAGQLHKSKSYDTLHKVYQVIFIEGKYPTNNNLVNYFESYNQDYQKEEDNLITRIYVHLPVIEEVVAKKGIEKLNGFEILCYLFETERKDAILKLEEAEGMAKIVMDKYEEFSKDEELWSWAQAIEDGIITAKSDISFARKEGVQEGRQEGRQEGKREGELLAMQETVKTLLEQRFGSMAKELENKIAEAKIEELKNILQSIFQIESLDEVEEKLER